MTSLKGVVKELRETARWLAESRGLRPEELPCRSDAILLLVVAALKEVEMEEATTSSSLSAVSDVAAAARAARHTLRQYLPSVPQEGKLKLDSKGAKRARPEAADEKKSDDIDSDLGQYSRTRVFEDNAKRRAKFARLMGGGKHEESHHNTFAVNASTMKRISGELEEQFNAALHRHGKKGLGA